MHVVFGVVIVVVLWFLVGAIASVGEAIRDKDKRD